MNTIKLNHFLCIAFAGILLSCTPKSSLPNSEYFAFKETKSDKWGLVDKNGNILVKDEFSEKPYHIYNGVFFVENNSGKISMYSTKKPTIPIGDGYVDICPFMSNITPSVKENEVIKIINTDGVVQFELPAKYTYATPFYFGYSVVYNKELDRNGILTANGKIINSDKYSILQPLPSDRFLAKDLEDDSNIFLLNGKLEKVEHLCKYDDFQYITPDMKYFAYSSEDGVGLKTIDGENVIRPKYKYLAYANEKCIIVYDDDLEESCGVININGDILIRPKYKYFSALKDNCLAVYDSDKERYGLINIKGDILLPFEYSIIASIPETKYFAVQPHGDPYCFFVDKMGKKIDKMEYYSLEIPDSRGDIDDLISYYMYYYGQPTVKSDYLDINDIVRVMLDKAEGPMSQFTRFVGKSPETVSNSLDLSLTYDDIDSFLQMEWLPSQSYSFKACDKYGRLSYFLGFDEIVEEYTNYDYYYSRTQYRFSSKGKCQAIGIELKLNSELSRKEEKILNGLESALQANGYTKDQNYMTAVYNDNYTVFYSCEDGLLTFVVEPRKNSSI